MEEQQQKSPQQGARLCPKDCKMCSMPQQVYCSSQLSFTAFEVLSQIHSLLVDLKSQLSSMQKVDEGLASPICEGKQKERKSTQPQ